MSQPTDELRLRDGVSDFTAAADMQRRWAQRVRHTPLPVKIRTVGGADAVFPSRSGVCLAGIVILSFPDLQPLQRVWATAELKTPYVPGFLSFREAPAVFAAADQLDQLPDVLFIDGQGLAHPRRFGLACHIGLALDLPTIGCGKSRLIGTHETVGPEKGSRRDLRHQDQVIGTALRTRSNCREIYISVGHRCTLDDAIDLTLCCTPRYRVPEPTRQADKWVALKRQEFIDTPPAS